MNNIQGIPPQSNMLALRIVFFFFFLLTRFFFKHFFFYCGKSTCYHLNHLFKLEDDGFTMLHYFLPHSSMTQL